MKNPITLFLAVGLSAMAYAQAPAGVAAAPAGQAAPPAPAPLAGPATKVAIIQLQQAVLKTQDGQKASAEMQTKFGARKQALEKEDSDLKAMQDQFNKGAATMSDAAKQKMAADISNGQKKLQREGEDFQADVQNADNTLMQEIVTKMIDVVSKYAAQNGFALVLDVSSQQSPVIWADQAYVITEPIVKLYDQLHPNTAAPAAPVTAPAKPPAAPAVKKQ